MTKRTRTRTKPIFFNPSDPVKTTYYSLEKKTKRKRSTKSWVKVCNKKKLVIEGLKFESYLKDEKRKSCPLKEKVNKYIASVVKKNDSCLVLDGPKARTTKELSKKHVGYVAIPNNTTSVVELEKFAKKKKHVDTFRMSLHDLVKTTRKRYDVIYMDTCGFFTTGKEDDLKSTIDLCFYRNLLKEGGIFGVTVSSRTKGDIKDAFQKCEEWVTTQNPDMKLCWEIKYGHFRTMFFR